jgi:hypothetical protein
LRNRKKLKLGDAHVTPRNIQEVQVSKLGDAPEAPLLHRQKSGHLSMHYIFIASCIMHFSWSVSCFSFQFYLVLFVAINVWTPTIFFGEVASLFICQEHSVFHSIRFHKCSLFLELRLAFDFCLGLCSDLVISFHQDIFLPLVHIGFHQKRCL